MNSSNCNHNSEKVNTCTENSQPERAVAVRSATPNAGASAALADAFAQADLEDSALDGDYSAAAELADQWEKRGLGLLTETPNYSIISGTAGINTDNLTYFASLDGQTAALVYGSKPSHAYEIFDNWLSDLEEQDVKTLDVDLAGVCWRFSRSAGGNYGYFAMLSGAGLTIQFCRTPGKTAGAEIPLCKVVFGWQLANTSNLEGVMGKVFQYLQILGCEGLRFHITRCDIQYTTNAFTMDDIEQMIAQNRVVTRCRKVRKVEGESGALEYCAWSSNKGGWTLRIYDKFKEVCEKGECDKLEWLTRFIGDGSNASMVRVEWELKRDFLRELGVTTFDDLYNSWQSLVTHIMAFLVRFVDRDKANHSERTKPADFWALIHSNLLGAGEGCQPLQHKQKPSQAIKLDKISHARFTSAAVTFLSKVIASDAATNETTLEEALYNAFYRLKSSIIDKSEQITDTGNLTWAGYSEFESFAG